MCHPGSGLELGITTSAEPAPSEVEGVAKFGEGGELLKCSFCGKSQKQVKKLIAGPGVYICDECIDLCNEIIAGERGGDDADPTLSREEAEEKELNRLGADGWELIWVAFAYATGPSRFYLRRLKENGAGDDAE